MSTTIELVDTKSIAQMLGVTQDHCTRHITKKPDFPKPAINVSRRLRRWRKTDVLKWMGIK